MLSRDYKDIIGGLILVVAGICYSWYSAESYDLGTLRRMGPGMFPMALGVVLAGFGLALMIPAFFRQGEMLRVRIWSPIFVLTGVGGFALTINPLGLFPAIVTGVVISSLAELRPRPLAVTALCVFLCALSWLTFRVGLGLTIPLWRWPF
jgi:hypothetical protein